MKLQVIEDIKGRPAGVFIPIKDWAVLEKKVNALNAFQVKNGPKKHLVNELREAFRELVLIERGKLKARPIEDLLNEL